MSSEKFAITIAIQGTADKNGAITRLQFAAIHCLKTARTHWILTITHTHTCAHTGNKKKITVKKINKSGGRQQQQQQQSPTQGQTNKKRQQNKCELFICATRPTRRMRNAWVRTRWVLCAVCSVCSVCPRISVRLGGSGIHTVQPAAAEAAAVAAAEEEAASASHWGMIESFFIGWRCHWSGKAPIVTPFFSSWAWFGVFLRALRRRRSQMKFPEMLSRWPLPQ